MGSISPPQEEDLSFPNLPPFPSDIPTLPLFRISLRNLLAGDASEEEKLWRACCDLGFFYFDLRSGNGTTEEGQSISGNDLLQAAEDMFALADNVFDLPVEEKQKYSMMGRNSYFGYKGYGAFVDRKGVSDRNEFWNVSKDDILGIKEALPNPEILTREESREKFRRYMLGSHAVVRLILGKLNARLGLPDGVYFTMRWDPLAYF